MIQRVELIADSAGPGRFRGGCGLRKDLRLLADNCTFYNLGDRQIFAPYGLAGGKTGRLGLTLLNPGTSRQRRLHSKGTYRLAHNDVISWRTSGAGGVGNPFARDPNAVLVDVRNGYVSVKAAAADYGVAIDGKTLALNPVRTRALRARSTAGRKRTKERVPA